MLPPAPAKLPLSRPAALARPNTLLALAIASLAILSLLGAGRGAAAAGGGRWRLLGLGRDAPAPPRTYVMLGLDLDSPEYAAVAPLTAYLWARAYRTPVTPVVLATARNATALSPSQAYILAALAEAGARVELFAMPAGGGGAPHHPVTGSQLVRLLGFALPGIAPTDVLLTSDLDLWPMSPAFWERALARGPPGARSSGTGGGDGLWVYNGPYTWKQTVKGGDHLAMSLLGATASTWCHLALRTLALHADAPTPAQLGRGGSKAPHPKRAPLPKGGNPEWAGAVGGALSALFTPDLRWDPRNPPTCTWRKRDGALRMRFPGPPGGGDGDGAAAGTPVTVTPTVSTLLGALLEAGRLVTGSVWPLNASAAEFKHSGSRLWFWDQTAVSAAERALGLCPTLEQLGLPSDSWPRCALNRDVRRLNRNEWISRGRAEALDAAAAVAAAAAAASGGGGGPSPAPHPRDRYTDAHVAPRWVLESPWRLLLPWGWVDPQAPAGSPFLHRYLAGLAATRLREGLRGPPVPVVEPPPAPTKARAKPAGAGAGTGARAAGAASASAGAPTPSNASSLPPPAPPARSRDSEGGDGVSEDEGGEAGSEGDEGAYAPEADARDAAQEDAAPLAGEGADAAEEPAEAVGNVQPAARRGGPPSPSPTAQASPSGGAAVAKPPPPGGGPPAGGGRAPAPRKPAPAEAAGGPGGKRA